MKNYKILFLVVGISLLLGCNSNFFQKKIITDYVSKGYPTFEYTFSDVGMRNLKIRFLSDSILKVSNRVIKEHTPSHHLWNFDVQYRYSSDDIGIIQVHEMLSSNSNFFTKENYLKPYSRDKFNSKENIFPDINGDTLFFSSDFMKIQVKEFLFSIDK